MAASRPGPEGHEPAPDPGSFRDPTNRVFLDGARVLRGLDEVALAEHQALEATELYRRGLSDGSLVGTTLLDDVPTTLPDGPWAAVLEHERIPVISYPYEWPFTMLKQAALLQLDLTAAALEEGFITKDATPYNVQFVGARPVHIDLGSFERLEPGTTWFGYRQLCEQMLFPLVLSARRGIDHQPLLRGSLRGVSPATCAASLSRRDLVRPSLFVHVTMHARADRKRLGEGRDVQGELKRAGFGPAVIKAQVAKLRRVVAGLERADGTTSWSEYSERGHYGDTSLAAKAAFVQRVAGQRHRRQLLDLGANDGWFTELVLDEVDHAVAVDGDPVVVDRLHRRLAERGDERVLPLVVDLADPSGGVGWRGRERPALAERLDPDLVLALALVHHLAITDSIPLEEVVAWLADFDAEVVLELPLPDDPMVQRLLSQKRQADLPRYSRERLEAALAQRFETLEVEQVGTRVLYHLRPSASSAPLASSVSTSREGTSDEA